VLITIPDNLHSALTAAEQILASGSARHLALDLVDCREALKPLHLHRLRRCAARARGLIFLLTNTKTRDVPAEQVCMCLHLKRVSGHNKEIVVQRSRIATTSRRLECFCHGD
jgi:hypothetical protein